MHFMASRLYGDFFHNSRRLPTRFAKVQTQNFVDLCRKHAQLHHEHQRRESCEIAVARTGRGGRGTTRSHPASPSRSRPFGAAERVALSPFDPCSTTDTVSLFSLFAEDLQLTWDSWSGLPDQTDCLLQAGLHPRLVPP